jgi:AraC-like DNA-binding protein
VQTAPASRRRQHHPGFTALGLETNHLNWHLHKRGLIQNPADKRGLGEWAQFVGASKRTLNRRFQDWRQQCQLLRGLEMLVAGDSVTRVALELGYEHSNALIVMFKRCLGSTPRRYLQLKN